MNGEHITHAAEPNYNENAAVAPPPPPQALRRHRTEGNVSGNLPPALALNRRRSDRAIHPCEHADHCVSTCEGYGRVCPASARLASRAACHAVERLSIDSAIFGLSVADESRTSRQLRCAAIRTEDLEFGDMLGRGGFSEVRVATMKVERVSLDDRNSTETEEEKEDGDTAVTVTAEAPTNISVSTKKGQQYAFKSLSKRVMVSAHSFKRGAADLAIEAQFLSELQHPHIIKLHGVAADGVKDGFASGKPGGFFLLIDRLYGTLEQRIATWRDLSSKYNGMLYRTSHDLRGCKRRAMLVERLRHAADLADAVRYLHSRRIVYRDLKPDNVGYDSQGVLKLFDFGLAKEMKRHKRNCHGTYNLSGNTGSKRYMAPEVALYKPYDERVDAYSFGIVLYELSSMEKPFKDWSANKHREEVVEGRNRPKIEHPHGAHSFWPSPLVDLIHVCWAHEMSRRPDFGLITKVLDKLCGNKERRNGWVSVIGKANSFSSSKSNTSDGTSDSGSYGGKLRKKISRRMRQTQTLLKKSSSLRSQGCSQGSAPMA